MPVEVFWSLAAARHQHKASTDGTSKPYSNQLNIQKISPYPEDQVSCVVVNALLPGNKCHLVANYIMDLCTQSAVERLIILSALHLDDSRFGSQPIYENCLASSKLTTYTSLPETTPVVDPFLSTLVQMVKVENIPTNLFVAPGYRTREGLVDDNTLQVILQFHTVLEKACGLRFDISISRNLVYKGSNDADGDLASMIYM